MAPPIIELADVSKRFVKPLDLAGRLARALGANLREEVVHAVEHELLPVPLVQIHRSQRQVARRDEVLIMVRLIRKWEKIARDLLARDGQVTLRSRSSENIVRTDVPREPIPASGGEARG